MASSLKVNRVVPSTGTNIGLGTASGEIRLASTSKLTFDGDTDTYIWHPQANQIAITKGGGSYPMIRFGSGGTGGTIAIGNTTTNLVTNSEILSVRGYSSFKSVNKDYAALYTHNEGGNGSGDKAVHLYFNWAGANRAGFGVETDNSTFIMNNGSDISFRTGNTALNGTERLRITNTGEIRIGGNEGGYKTTIIDESNRTTTAETALLLYAKHDGSSTTGAGFGTGIRFWGDRASGNVEQNMGRIMCTAETNSGTTLSGALSFETTVNGALSERLRIKSGGDIVATGNIQSNNLSGKNLLINGNFHVWQRSTSSSSTGFVAADRWYHNLSGANMTFSRQTHTNPIDGSPYYARIASTSSDDNCGLGYFVEDVRTIPEGKITVSFWARGHVNGNLAVWGTLYYGSGGSSDVDLTEQRTPYLQNDSTFRKYSLTFTIPSHSGKTFGTNSAFRLYLGQGSGDSASAWTLDISNIQLEVGSIATAFEQRSYAEELRLCQRYYWKHAHSGATTSLGLGMAWSGTEVDVPIRFPVPMRVKPTAIDSQGSGSNYYQIEGGGQSPSAYVDGNWTLQFANTYGGNIYATPDQTLTAGRAHHITMRNSAAYIAFSAEL